MKMNRYDIPLAAPSKQSILPVMHVDGRVIGFYPIASTSFEGTETTYTTSDGVVVPLRPVTVDVNDPLRKVTQYMAAVFYPEYRINVVPNQHVVQRSPEPWASADLIVGDSTAYRWYTQATQTWFMHFGDGKYIGALRNNLDFTLGVVAPPTPPDAEDATMEWRASVDYLALFGECTFFDFNWMTAFLQKATREPVRITVLENPAPIAPSTKHPLVAKVIGRPVATAKGVLYDSVRIIKLVDAIPPDDYVFKFEITDEKNLKTEVTFTLTVK